MNQNNLTFKDEANNTDYLVITVVTKQSVLVFNMLDKMSKREMTLTRVKSSWSDDWTRASLK